MNTSNASALYALKLTGIGYSTTTFVADSKITQAVGLNSIAVGKVASYEPTTGVLKYWQDRSNSGFTTSTGAPGAATTTGYESFAFTSSPATGGSLSIAGGDGSLSIDSGFSGLSTEINNRTYYLGQSFTDGVSQPEAKKYSGNIIFVDNRPSVTRSSSQKEDVKIILQF